MPNISLRGGTLDYDNVTVEIPTSAHLTAIDSVKYLRLNYYLRYKPILEGDCVVLSLPSYHDAKEGGQGPNDWVDELRMYWVEERHEWIAVRYHLYQENVQDTLATLDGPYSLNDDLAHKIVEAFGIASYSLTPVAIVQSSPTQLLELARS